MTNKLTELLLETAHIKSVIQLPNHQLLPLNHSISLQEQFADKIQFIESTNWKVQFIQKVGRVKNHFQI